MMTESHLIYLFYITLSLIIGNIILIHLKQFKVFKVVSILAILSGLASLVGVYLISGHLPVYEKFTTLPNMSVIVLILGFIYNRTPETKGRNLNLVWYVALVLHLIVLFYEKKPNGSYFMYEKFYVVGFFQFRIAAVALFLFAIANYLTALLKTTDHEFQKDLMHTARNFTLLGAVSYLIGECLGSWWCFLWWGDPWHWSSGFFFASIMFLLSMVSGHLPVKYIGTKNKKIILSLIPLCLIFLTYFIAH